METNGRRAVREKGNKRMQINPMTQQTGHRVPERIERIREAKHKSVMSLDLLSHD